LISLRLQRDAACKKADAERALNYPTISAVGAAGLVPVHDSHLRDSYAAAGVNLSLPLFAGGAYTARSKQARLDAQRAEEVRRDAENLAICDVRTSWQNVQYALERLSLTRELLDTSAEALLLASTRYKLGSSSIIELSQAQLNKTSAEISYTNA